MIRFRRWLWAAAFLPVGCIGPSRIVSDGIPVRRLPDEVLGCSKCELQPVPLNLLRRSDASEYRLDKGDTIGVFVEDVLGNRGQPIPVNPGSDSRPASIGYPVKVQDDGTILLPDLPPFSVRGKTLAETQQLIAGMVTGDFFLAGSKRLLVKGTEKVVVDLVQPRKVRVQVVREVPGAKAMSATVELHPQRNDLLEALNRTGGLPGLESKNEVVIRRGVYNPGDPCQGLVRIPLRTRCYEPVAFTEQDITLNDGDTVFIESREAEVFYTAGLLGSHQVTLPRDRDLRVTDAIALVPSPLIGVHSPTCGTVTVVRRFPCVQGEIRIRVDLAEAFRDTRENILIHPGDVLVMQDGPCTTGWDRTLKCVKGIGRSVP
jgi:protein involved in polysaccharide export with SLBB domain